MNNLHKIIEQIQKDLNCPVCGKSFKIGEIRIRGLFDHTVVVQTICDNNHVTLFMTRYQNKSGEIPPISTKEIYQLHQTLKKFDGDFEKKWNQ